MKRPPFRGTAALLCLAAWIGTGAGMAWAQTEIEGTGAAFPAPIYRQWFDAYAKVDTTSHFDYEPVDSGAGQREILARRVDFGASEAPLDDAAILQIPTVAGAVAITYNIPDMPPLRFDAATLAAIFLGRITRWDDPRLSALNPGVPLMALDISVIHRSDASGLSYLFTDYLSKVSPEWKAAAGAGLSVGWPVGVGLRGNQEVMGRIRRTPGSIGYVELLGVVRNRMPCAELQNRAGKFIAPTPGSIAAALEAAPIPADLRFSLTDTAGAAAYPICGVAWFLADFRQNDPEKGKRLRRFLRWAVTAGQPLVEPLACAPLPPTIQRRALARLDAM